MPTSKSTVSPFLAQSSPLDYYSSLERRKGFLTVDELAEELKVSTKSIYRMCKKGILPSVRVGSQIRLETVTTARWLRARAGIKA